MLPGSLLPIGWDVAESVGTKAATLGSEMEPRTASFRTTLPAQASLREIESKLVSCINYCIN